MQTAVISTSCLLVRLSVTFQFLVQTIRSRGLQYQVSSMFDELRPETAECCWLILACIYNCSYNYNYCNGRSDCLSVCPSVRHVPVFSVAHPKGIKGCIPTGGRLEWHSLSYEMRSCAFCMLVTSFCGPPGKLHVLFTKRCMSWMMERIRWRIGWVIVTSVPAVTVMKHDACMYMYTAIL